MIGTSPEEILVADDPEDVVRLLRDIPDERRRAIAAAARKRVLRSHSAAERAKQLEDYYAEVANGTLFNAPRLRADKDDVDAVA